MKSIPDIRLVPHKDIDLRKWDDCMHRSVNNTLYGHSWYLNLVSQRWDALVEGDYERIFPLPYQEKMGFRYICMPPFTQQLGLFSPALLDQEIVREFLRAIPKRFRIVDLNLNALNKVEDPVFKPRINRNYELDLISGVDAIRAGYSTNLKRNLQKARQAGLVLTPVVPPSEIISLFRKNRGSRLRSLDDEAYRVLERLIHGLLHRGMARVMGATLGPNILMGALVMAVLPGRSILLFSATERDMDNHNALAWLIDNYIQEHAGTRRVLDFEGSNDENLGRFYASFGAIETTYPSIHLNTLHPWQRCGLSLYRRLRYH